MPQADKFNFIRVTDDINMIEKIQSILKTCGEDMYKNQGLDHWLNPYPIELIKNDCENSEVYILKNETEIATFQLKKDDKGYLLSKFGVLPTYSGKGIGKKCLQFIYGKCIENQISLLHLDVYEKSEKAIEFYIKNGFEVYGTAPTRRFKVVLMERKIQ